jgi:hypothetical protein
MEMALLPIPFLYVILNIGILITIIAGIAMLKGYNWARLLYVVWKVIAFIWAIITFRVKLLMIPDLVIFLFITFFLFRPKVNEFFSQKIFVNDSQHV